MQFDAVKKKMRKHLQSPKLRRSLVGLVIGSLVLGMGVAAGRQGLLRGWFHSGKTDSIETAQDAKTLTQLAQTSDDDRLARLTTLAQGPKSLSQSRARYLLASDLIRKTQGSQALALLNGLEAEYPVLSAHIMRQRAKAYEVLGDQAQATATWQQLIQQFPDSPVVAEALVALAPTDSRYGQQAIAQFPSHPTVLDMVRQQIRQAPQQPKLLLHLVRHAHYSPGIVAVADRLVKMQAQANLTPEDWQAIAFTYWENQIYGSAGRAYARAPRTSRNLYRAGRGLQLADQTATAIGFYQQVVQAFPTTPEAALALTRLAKLAPTSQAAIAYLDQIIQRFPEQAAEALLMKAEELDRLNSQASASQVRQLLLTRYANSDAAADLRWQQAQKQAKAGNSQAAIRWAEPILQYNSGSEIAPEAAFWIGKWFLKLGNPAKARQTFEHVLKQYPDSYYAWRSASLLGLSVGSFTTVRQLSPRLAFPDRPADLPAGSPALKELHALGQAEDAWKLWQVEFKTPQTPTVAEQFTDGVMRIGIGDYLNGIFMITSLSQRDTPSDRAAYQALKRQPLYWQALYPFPYLESVKNWSEQRQLNPLLVIALIRQESRFQPRIQSVVGATGLMQVMPDTGEWIAEKIKLKGYDLNQPDDNIQLGTWYLDYTHEQYEDHSLLAIASYNAGPGNVEDWLVGKGLSDPDEFVSEIPFDETRGYVKSVFENYWNYKRLYDPDVAALMSRYTENSSDTPLQNPQ